MATDQVYLLSDSSTVANFYNWANGISNALVAIGLTRLTTSSDPGVVQWANVQSGLATWTTASGQAPQQPPRPTLFNTIAAWSSSSVSYVGLSSSATSGTASVVTYNGLTWICVSNNTSSSSNAPGTSGGSSYWYPYLYDIFKTNDTLSSTFPMYFKIVYYSVTFASNYVGMYWSWGTVINGNCGLGGQQPPAPNGSGGLNEIVVWTSGSGIADLGSALNECDFCGNGQGGVGNVSFILWRGTTNEVSLVLDRSKDQNGNDTGSYYTLIYTDGYGNTSGSGLYFIPAPGSGSPFGSSGSPGASVPCIYTGMSTNFWGSLAFLPIFPLIGYVANPMLGAGCMWGADCVAGGLISVVLYGTTHTFLVTKGYPKNITPMGANGAYLIRWE